MNRLVPFSEFEGQSTKSSEFWYSHAEETRARGESFTDTACRKQMLMLAEQYMAFGDFWKKWEDHLKIIDEEIKKQIRDDSL